MKKIIKIISIIMAFALVISAGIIGCQSEVEQENKYSITLNHTSIEIDERSSCTLVASVSEDGVVVTDKKVIFSSNNESIAKVDSNGKVTPVAIGETQIVCKLENENVSAICVVKVVKYYEPQTMLVLDRTDISIAFEENFKITLNLKAYKDGKEIEVSPTWSSSNGAVATVENGVVTIVGQGKCEITVKVQDGEYYSSAKCVINVGSEIDEDDIHDVTGGDIEW